MKEAYAGDHLNTDSACDETFTVFTENDYGSIAEPGTILLFKLSQGNKMSLIFVYWYRHMKNELQHRLRVFSYMQVADAANDAAFEMAVGAVTQWAEASGFDNVVNVTLAQQDSFVKQLLRQWVLYRCV